MATDPFLGDIGISLDAPKAKAYAPLDAALRTVYAEAPPNASPDELKAIASVIANRAKKSGKDVGAVVQEPGQFESWKNGRDRIDGLDPASPDYAALQGTVGDILAGKADPTTDATLFYAPEAQAAKAPKDGRPVKPAWDDGTGTRIGSHLFFGDGSGGDAFLADIGVDHKAVIGAPDPDKAELTSEHLIDPAGTIQPGVLTKQQQSARDTLFRGGGIEAKAPPGTKTHPYFLGPDDKPENAPAGAYYIDQKGHMGRVPGGGQDSSVTAGLGRGMGDVAESVGTLLPGAGDSEILARLKAGSMQYGAEYGGDLKSGIARFGGQVLGSLPLMAGAEAAAVPAMTRFLGPAGEFLAGVAGKGALAPTAGAGARVGQLALRAGSLAASGAQEGAGAALLTHSADDRPLGEQVATGAVLGGVLKPAATVAAKGMKRFFGGADLTGAEDIAAQRELAAKAGGLPVPPPLSLGDLTGSPAQQMAENGLLRGTGGDAAAGVVQSFDAAQDAALKGNVHAIADMMAGAAHEAGSGGKIVSDRLNAMRDAANAAVNAAYEEARKTGNDAMLPNSTDVRDAMLKGLREGYDLDAVPRVTKAVESFGENGVPTARELFDARTKISNLTQSSDQVEAGAARAAKSVMDGYIKSALDNDLFIGDPKAVEAWRTAIGKRAEFGRLFEGDDLIDGLTERVSRGGGRTLKVDPDEATNYILNRSALGWVGKKDLGRDLTRVRDVLGKDSDEWNALRADLFSRIGRAGAGPTEGGEQRFSGANFLKAWNKAKSESPQVVGVMFSPGERKLIDDFAEVAQRITSPVKGGDNASNSAITGKQLLDPVFRFIGVSGGAGAGAALGGPGGAAAGAAMGGLMKTLQEIVAVAKARKFTYGAKPMVDNSGRRPLLTGPAPGVVGGVLANSLPGSGPPQQ